MVIKRSDGSAVLFCYTCLETNGYPTPYQLQQRRDDVENAQAVTIHKGEALCEMHFNNVVNIDKMTLKKE